MISPQSILQTSSRLEYEENYPHFSDSFSGTNTLIYPPENSHVPLFRDHFWGGKNYLPSISQFWGANCFPCLNFSMNLRVPTPMPTPPGNSRPERSGLRRENDEDDGLHKPSSYTESSPHENRPFHAPIQENHWLQPLILRGCVGFRQVWFASFSSGFPNKKPKQNQWHNSLQVFALREELVPSEGWWGGESLIDLLEFSGEFFTLYRCWCLNFDTFLNLFVASHQQL